MLDDDLEHNWARWKKRVIEKQIKTANGAERYIKSGGKIFLDTELNQEIPTKFDYRECVVHKTVVAHGAKDACRKATGTSSGSLAISYGLNLNIPFPFHVELDKDSFIHVLDSATLNIILSELDTFSDLVNYFVAKKEAIEKYDSLIYSGEEDLLAHYFLNFDENEQRQKIVVPDNANIAVINENWSEFILKKQYLNKQQANKISYLWDKIIKKTGNNALEGTLNGASPLTTDTAVHEMAKEPRIIRRALSEMLKEAIVSFPEETRAKTMKTRYMKSSTPEKAYIFLQLANYSDIYTYNEYRQFRQLALATACGKISILNRALSIVVGVVIDSPKYSKDSSKNLVLMHCRELSDRDRQEIEKSNENFGFFKNGYKPSFRQFDEFPED